MIGHKKIRPALLISMTLPILAGLLSGPLPARSADLVRQPVQRAPAPAPTPVAPVQKSPTPQTIRKPITQPATRTAVPWQPVSQHVSLFEQNRGRLRGLVQDMGSGTEANALAQSLQKLQDEMASLRELMAEIREQLDEIMREIDAVSSLMRQAAMADRSKSFAPGRGDQLVRDLERRLAVLEKKKEQLANLMESLENQYQTMSDMSQQLRMQLQDAMNKQQQAMQILSNIMKNQHDTLKAIIQNMR